MSKTKTSTIAEIIIANAYIEYQHGVPCICYKNGDTRYARVDDIRGWLPKEFGKVMAKIIEEDMDKEFFGGGENEYYQD